MKIIRSGEPNRHQSVKRFECDRCGCVFEAGDGEYEVGNITYYWGKVCVSKCPHCTNRVFVFQKSIVDVIDEICESNYCDC